MPPPPAYESGLDATPEVPRQVDWAVKILFLAAAWQLIGMVLSLANSGRAEDSIRETNPDFTDAQVQNAMNVGRVSVVVFSVAFALLYFVCGRKMRQGRGWARVVGTVLFALAVLTGVVGVSVATGVGRAVQVVGVLIGVAFLVLSWTKPANAFFAANRNAPVQR